MARREIGAPRRRRGRGWRLNRQRLKLKCSQKRCGACATKPKSAYLWSLVWGFGSLFFLLVFVKKKMFFFFCSLGSLALLGLPFVKMHLWSYFVVRLLVPFRRKRVCISGLYFFFLFVIFIFFIIVNAQKTKENFSRRRQSVWRVWPDLSCPYLLRSLIFWAVLPAWLLSRRFWLFLAKSVVQNMSP